MDEKEVVRSSAVIYESFLDASNDFSDAEFREAWTALLNYAFYDEMPDGLSPLSKAFFKLTKKNVDSVIAKREGGANGGRPKKPKVSESKTIGYESENHRLLKSKPKVSGSETSLIYDEDVDVDEDIDIDVDVDRQTIDKDQEAAADGGQSGQSGNTPTYEDVVKECREKKYSAAIASKFFMHYDRSGWKTNDGDPVRDWKKMLGIWVNNEKEEKPPNKRGKPSGWKEYQQRGTETNEELEAMLLDMGG